MIKDLFDAYVGPMFLAVMVLAGLGVLSIVLGFVAVIALAVHSLF